MGEGISSVWWISGEAMPKKPKNFPKGSAQEQDKELDEVRKEFQTVQDVGPLRWECTIRRRMQFDAHAHQVNNSFIARLDSCFFNNSYRGI